MMDQTAPPLIFEYLDAVSYLQDYYKWRKSLNSKFSYENLAEDLQFKSRSYIRMVFLGKKKISQTFLQAFSNMNCRNEKEKEFFQVLVEYTQTKNRTEKDILGRKLSFILRNDIARKDVPCEKKSFISNPLIPRLFTLLTFRDLNKNSETLSRVLNISLEQTEESLNILSQIDLIHYDKARNEWVAHFDYFKVPDDKGNFNLLNFHEASLKDAIKSFAMPKETRRFESLLLPMNKDELKNFNEQLNDFIQLQLSTLRAQKLQDRRLYQININLHAFTIEHKATDCLIEN